jgi:hypothetical protein
MLILGEQCKSSICAVPFVLLSPKESRIKNPGPKDPALGCPLRGLLWFFLFAVVCWSDGVVE